MCTKLRSNRIRFPLMHGWNPHCVFFSCDMSLNSESYLYPRPPISVLVPKDAAQTKHMNNCSQKKLQNTYTATYINLYESILPPLFKWQLSQTHPGFQPTFPQHLPERPCVAPQVALMTMDVPPPKGPLFIFGDPFLRKRLRLGGFFGAWENQGRPWGWSFWLVETPYK